MNRTSLIVPAALGVLASLSCPAASAADADLQALREEIAQMRKTYEARIASLENRLAETAAQAGAAQSAAVSAQAASRPSASESSFNPAISAVLMGTYTHLSRSPASYAIGGFVPSGGEVAPPSRGFGLGESEIGIAANIDPTLRGQLTFALTPENEAEVEEAFVQTLGLGGGLTLKAGRFLSGVGYMNGQHAHAWDFADAPLAYKAMLGGQLKSDGAQLKWVAPTTLLFELGVEAAAGGNFPATERDKNGPALGAVFAHLGGDAGASSSWRLGLSYLGTSPRDRQYEDSDATGAVVTNAFSGRSRTLILDGVWKWAPNGNATERSLVVQGEYFRRRETGSLGFDVDGAGLDGDYRARQSGFYAQAVYQFMPRWRVGYRYDRLDSGSTAIGRVDDGTLTAADFPLLAAYQPRRDTVMLDWSPSEFQRWRLQLARDRSRPDATDNQVWLQYIVSLGAHGAHNY
jgi:hypothetical protein